MWHIWYLFIFRSVAPAQRLPVSATGKPAAALFGFLGPTVALFTPARCTARHWSRPDLGTTQPKFLAVSCLSVSFVCSFPPRRVNPIVTLFLCFLLCFKEVENSDSNRQRITREEGGQQRPCKAILSLFPSLPHSIPPHFPGLSFLPLLEHVLLPLSLLSLLSTHTHPYRSFPTASKCAPYLHRHLAIRNFWLRPLLFSSPTLSCILPLRVPCTAATLSIRPFTFLCLLRPSSIQVSNVNIHPATF